MDEMFHELDNSQKIEWGSLMYEHDKKMSDELLNKVDQEITEYLDSISKEPEKKIASLDGVDIVFYDIVNGSTFLRMIHASNKCGYNADTDTLKLEFKATSSFVDQYLKTRVVPVVMLMRENKGTRPFVLGGIHLRGNEFPFHVTHKHENAYEYSIDATYEYSGLFDMSKTLTYTLTVQQASERTDGLSMFYYMYRDKILG